MEYPVEELLRMIKDLEKRVSALEANFKIQPAAINPVKKEEDDLDDRMQCWGCGQMCDEGVIHKCEGR